MGVLSDDAKPNAIWVYQCYAVALIVVQVVPHRRSAFLAPIALLVPILFQPFWILILFHIPE